MEVEVDLKQVQNTFNEWLLSWYLKTNPSIFSRENIISKQVFDKIMELHVVMNKQVWKPTNLGNFNSCLLRPTLLFPFFFWEMGKMKNRAFLQYFFGPFTWQQFFSVLQKRSYKLLELSSDNAHINLKHLFRSLKHLFHLFSNVGDKISKSLRCNLISHTCTFYKTQTYIFVSPMIWDLS